MGSLQQLAIVLGIFATGITNYVIVSLAGSSTSDWLLGIEAWRWMFLIMLIPAAIYFLMVLRIPESPRFLVERGKLDEAREVLESVFTTDQSAKVLEIQRTMEGANRSRISDLRGSRFGLMPIVWIGILLSAFQQFVGINAVFHYSNLIWESVGFSQDQAFLTSMITNGVNVATTLVAIALIDRIGRKRLLLIRSSGMVVMLAALTVIFGTAPQVSNGEGGMEPSLVGATATFAVVASAQWIANFIVSSAFPPIAARSLTIAYGIVTVFAIASIIFVKRKVPETTGKSLEQISEESVSLAA